MNKTISLKVSNDADETNYLSARDINYLEKQSDLEGEPIGLFASRLLKKVIDVASKKKN